LANQRFYILALCSLTFWACSLAPIGKLAKGVCLILGLYCATETMHHSQRLINEQALAGATEAMIQELQRVELALATHAEEEELKKQYALEATYPPEVSRELKDSLEHLYKEPSASATSETSASTSAERKAFYLAVSNLLQSHPPTYIIEEILGYRGRNFKIGKGILEDLLQEGEQNGWG
jgi:metal-dependent amidase/aminoacylase/carboxypeptidase family protein